MGPFLPREGQGKFCFLCDFRLHDERVVPNPFVRDEMAETYEEMCRFCSDWEGKYRVSTAIEAIDRIYRERIQLVHPHLPNWDKCAIYEHIFQHTGTPQRQVAGVADALQTQILHLQQCAWERDSEGAPATPNLRHLAMLEKLSARLFEAIKLRQSLL